MTTVNERFNAMRNIRGWLDKIFHAEEEFPKGKRAGREKAYRLGKHFPELWFIGILERDYGLRDELLELINKERDEGNIGKHEFSAALCLSKVIKRLKGDID